MEKKLGRLEATHLISDTMACADGFQHKSYPDYQPTITAGNIISAMRHWLFPAGLDCIQLRILLDCTVHPAANLAGTGDFYLYTGFSANKAGNCSAGYNSLSGWTTYPYDYVIVPADGIGHAGTETEGADVV